MSKRNSIWLKSCWVKLMHGNSIYRNITAAYHISTLNARKLLYVVNYVDDYGKCLGNKTVTKVTKHLQNSLNLNNVDTTGYLCILPQQTWWWSVEVEFELVGWHARLGHDAGDTHAAELLAVCRLIEECKDVWRSDTRSVPRHSTVLNVEC